MTERKARRDLKVLVDDDILFQIEKNKKSTYYELTV